MVAAGIDIGSTGTKAVIFDGEIRASVVVPTGWDPKAAGLEAYRQALACAGITANEAQSIVGTGYGRVSPPYSTGRSPRSPAMPAVPISCTRKRAA